MHQHDENCAHDHHHEHGENCGCGHDHAPMPTSDSLSPIQVDILLELRQRGCLPVACFSITKADDGERYMIALAPAYISSPDDSMEQVKALGEQLSQLEDMDLIALDYDIPIRDYPYDEYKTSKLYTYFVKTVEAAAQQPNPAFDTPNLELGSMTLTDAGDQMVDELIK